jgi:hypothetical protein
VGTYKFVQTISSYLLEWKEADQPGGIPGKTHRAEQSVADNGGLPFIDTRIPVNPHPTDPRRAYDSPLWPVPFDARTAIRNSNFDTYLVWTSGKAGSVAVAVRTLGWDFLWEAVSTDGESWAFTAEHLHVDGVDSAAPELRTLNTQHPVYRIVP